MSLTKNILIADDFPLFRRGVKDILLESFVGVKIGEAGTAQEVLALAKSDTWDAAVIDISMPGRSGPELVHELKREWPNLPILVLSMHPEEQFAIRMFKSGADGYLNKASVPSELVIALNKIMAGGKYVSPIAAERLASDITIQGRERMQHDCLSDREYQVLCLIASGKSTTDIAEYLCLSMTTISTYRARVLQKLHLINNMDIVRYAFQHKLVQ